MEPHGSRRNLVPQRKINRTQLQNLYSHPGPETVGSPALGGYSVVEVHNMKRTLAVLGMLAATSVTPTLAADLSRPVYKAPPPMTAPIAVFNWTGFYIGANAGAGWSGHDGQSFLVPGVSNPVHLGGNHNAGFI